MEDEETEFEQNFLKFPSSFSLRIEELKKKKHIDLNRKKLELKCTSRELKSTVELTRLYNLLSFLHWSAEENKKAYDYNSKALEEDRENIVALCNRVWMKRKDGDLTESKEMLDQIEKLSECKRHLVLQGEAEIAYSYSVFGPKYFTQSINLYEELLSKASVEDVGVNILQLWKLDLGIIYRKYCNLGGSLPRQGQMERDTNECIKKAAALLYEVASSNCPPRWKGKCFASLAEFSYSMHIWRHLTGSQKELFPKELADIKVQTLLSRALDTCAEDSHVLRVCGKLFKYMNNLDKAEELLRTSLNIIETAYGHHHLAMVLKKKLRNKLWEHNVLPDGESQVSDYVYHGLEAQCSGLNSIRRETTDKESVKEEVARRSQNSSRNQQRKVTEIDYCDSSQQDHILKRATVKGFRSVFSIPNDEKEAVEEIMHHLDKGIELGNEWSSFEKGLLLRQINEPEKAFETFLKTLKIREFSTTIVTVSCYEQLGVCRTESAKKELDRDKKRQLEADAVKYLRKAIEVLAYKASIELSYLTDGWMAYPTLKSMFQTQKRDVATLKILADLSQILKKHGDTLDFYTQIIELDKNQANDSNIICGKIQILLDEREFEQAAVLLDLHSCTKAKDEISKEVCKKVYLEYAFHLVKMKQNENAGQRFRQAFAIDCTKIPRKDADYDIFILYDEDSDETGNSSRAFKLGKKLDNFVPGEQGLRITCNLDKVSPGRLWKREQRQQMESSIHIVLILDTNEEPSEELMYGIEIAQKFEKEQKSKLSLILVDDCTCPLDLTNFPRIKFDTNLFQCEDRLNEWIGKFIFHLLGIPKREH